MKLFHPDIWRRQIRDALIYWVYLPALVLGGGMLVDRFISAALKPHVTAGFFCLLAGGLVIWRATVDLEMHGGGTPSPFRPAKKLVTEGVYRFCRHPMWLGYDIMALGTVFLLGSRGALYIAYPLFILGQIIYLRKEEKILLAKFKQRYTEYQQRTNLLIPLLRNPFQKRS